MESSKRSLFCVMAKVFGILYCHVFFVSFGRWLATWDLVLWKLVFFNCGHGDINSRCASTHEGDTTKPSGRDGI